MHLRSLHLPCFSESVKKFSLMGSKGRIRNFALFGLAAALQIGAANSQVAAADPRIGAWTLVSAQSTLNPPNTLSITPLHNNELHVVMSGETSIDFTAKSDGHATAVLGNPAFNQVTLRKIDKRQSEVTEKKDGAVVATVRDKLSQDGKELTITTASAGHPDQITVWTRSGGAKVGPGPSRRRMDGGSQQDSFAARVAAQDRGGWQWRGPFFGWVQLHCPF